MTKPLDDITIIEIDNWMAAPSAAAILSDMGARVIKVEPHSGDPMRNMSRPLKAEHEMDGHDFQFDIDNRGKESVCVDLTKAEGADLVRKMVGKAQVFMCNLLAARQEKYGLDPDTLLKVNPTLVHATLTGYGTKGPEAWRPGYDVTAFFGRSGLYDSMREGDDGLVPMARPAQGDHTTGLALVGAILGALRQAERTGEGQVVETSLFETAVWTQATDYSVTVVDEVPVRKRARHEQLSATANRFPCKDGNWIVLNMPEPFWWPRLCEAMGKPEWIEDPRYKEGRDRYRAMTKLVAELDAVFMTKTRDEWGSIFDEHGIIWGPVMGIHEVVADEQASAINLFPTIQTDQGAYRTVRIPMNFHTFDALPSEPSPEKGQHTSEVLQELGLDSGEIEALRASEVIPK